jgi:photosystem II stability/assembly factor-like uncharacterized protein
MQRLPLRLMIAILTFVIGVVVSTAWLTPHRSSVELFNAIPEPTQDDFQLIAVSPRYQYSQYECTDAAILENGEIWCVGYDGYDPRRMWHSIDGGNAWEMKSIKSSGFTLHAISFADTQHGWAVGGYGLIMRTKDGGQTWDQLKRPTDFDLHAIHFINSQVGYVAGRRWLRDKTGAETHSIEILKTTNGGETWRRVYKDDGSGSVFKFATLGEEIVVAAIDGRRLIRTEDAGKTWQAVGANVPGISAVMFDQRGMGWAVGSKGGFHRSLDGGITWERPANLPTNLLNRYWWDIAFENSNLGLAIGDHGAFAVTHDGGATWVEKDIGTSDNLGIIRHNGPVGLVLGQQNVYKLNWKS